MCDVYQTKVTQTDAGSILFPSMTLCKDEMFDNVKYSDRGLLSRLLSGEVLAENAKTWFLNRTRSRKQLVKFLSVRTAEGFNNNNFPCNTVSGPRAGEPCTFPFIFPDCQLLIQSERCEADPGMAGVVYAGCFKAAWSTLIGRGMSGLGSHWPIAP